MFAALLPLASVDCRPTSKRTSHKILGLSAYSDRKALFIHFPFPRSVRKALPCFSEAPRLGLATHSAGFSSGLPTLGNLFQFPTLVGFTLQSFFPFEGSGSCFQLRLPFLRFFVKPHGPHACASTAYSLSKSGAPLCSQGFNPGRDHMLS